MLNLQLVQLNNHTDHHLGIQLQMIVKNNELSIIFNFKY